MAAPKILIIGASGYLGPYITAEFLRQREKFGRLAVLTEEAKRGKFKSLENQGFEIVVGSFFDKESFEGFDTVISLLGNHAMKHQPAIADAAFAAGVIDFYPSEFGSDIEHGESIHNRYFQDKIITRNALRKKLADHPDKNYNYTLMVVGAFTEFALNPLFGGDEETKTFTFYGDGSKTQVFTSIADVARFTVASTLLPKSPTRAREFRTCGGVYTWDEIIATISQTSGDEYKPVFLPNEEARRLAKEYREKGDVDQELAYALKALMGSEGFQAVPMPWDNEKFDIVPENLELALKRYFDERK